MSNSIRIEYDTLFLISSSNEPFENNRRKFIQYRRRLFPTNSLLISTVKLIDVIRHLNLWSNQLRQAQCDIETISKWVPSGSFIFGKKAKRALFKKDQSNWFEWWWFVVDLMQREILIKKEVKFSQKKDFGVRHSSFFSSSKCIVVNKNFLRNYLDEQRRKALAALFSCSSWNND